VLVVDDNALFAKATAAMVANAGVHADAVNDGFAALVTLANARYDLILLDLEMPGLDGRRTALEIRRRYGRRPPIVLISAHSGRALTALSAGTGVDDLLSKPFDQGELDTILARWLRPPPPDDKGPLSQGTSAEVARRTLRANTTLKTRPPR
jgi:CheY-like chemotaxis protein